MTASIIDYLKKLFGRLKGYRTAIFGIIIAILPVLDSLTNSGLVSMLVKDPERAALFTSSLGIFVVILRAITSTPMGQSQYPMPDQDTIIAPTDSVSTGEGFISREEETQP